MDKGQIAEQGSHTELMLQQGIYHYLMQIQQGGPATTQAAPATAQPATAPSAQAKTVQVASLVPAAAANPAAATENGEPA